MNVLMMKCSVMFKGFYNEYNSYVYTKQTSAFVYSLAYF